MKKFHIREGSILWTLASLALTMTGIYLGVSSLPALEKIILLLVLLGTPLIVLWLRGRGEGSRPPRGEEGKENQ